MEKKEFVHLHLHTQYSMLDGAILIDKLIPRAKELGMTSIAITDHGAMYGVVDFYQVCKKAGIKPIIGCEVYISTGSRHDREYTQSQSSSYHLILLAKNNIGFANLRKLASMAQLEGFYKRPRIDKEILSQYAEGLIGLSACLGGEIPQKIMREDYQKARDAAVEYNKILGDGNFYLEIQHNGIPEQMVVNKQLSNISEETGIPLVATCDCHYLNKGDHESHTVLMCIQTSSTISNPNRMETASEELYVKSPEEMYAHFPKNQEAVANSAKIAEQCNVDIKFGELHLPNYDVPTEFDTPEKYFRHLSLEGLAKRLASVPEEKHQEYYDRLSMEMDVIELKGYVGYFLIVWDFINYSKRNKISVGPGRGSGAGSLVAYALEITDIDPIQLNLLFERFLNPERPSLPDFDIDFCVRRRDEVIQYVRNKYGHDRVAQIVTFGRLSGRSVVRDVCRVLEIPLKEVDLLAKSIPETPGMTLTKALQIDPAVKSAFDKNPKGKEILKHALNLEGLLRHAGMHAAGVVIADKPLTEYVPLCKGKSKGDADDLGLDVLVQYEKGLLEKLGLVKFDFLGLANLTIIADAVERIHREVDANFDIGKIPYDEKDVYEMLSRGESTGVFQLESDGMRRLMKKLQPSVLEDIIALNALFRPGPIGSGMLDLFCDRKHGVQEIKYDLPILESILKETYGIIVYQEQVMEIARVVAGYSLGAADILRRAMGKKDEKEMQQQKSIFIDGDEKLKIPGAKKLGFDVKIAEDIFNLMEKFAEYGFNKSHSAAYAVLAYQTAYLRCKYTAQFLAAAMSSAEGTLEKVIPYIDDSRNMGIEVYPPNINISGAHFEHINGAIWFGLKAIKNVGSNAVDHIIAEREAKGSFKSIYDLCNRLDSKMINRKALESLIYSGAFDCFGKNRKQHLGVLESAIEHAHLKNRMKEQGLRSIEDFLFADDEDYEPEEESEYYPDVEEMADSELLSAEKAVLSIYFTSHPVQHAVTLSRGSFDNSEQVTTSDSGTNVKLLGMVKSVKRLLTNKNDPTKKKQNMASFIMEDLTGTAECVIFPRTYEAQGDLLQGEHLVVVEGVWKREGDRASVQVSALHDFSQALEKFARCLVICVDLPTFTDDLAVKLYSLISQNPGAMNLTLRFERGDGYNIEYPIPAKFRIKPSDEFLEKLEGLFGKNCYYVASDRAPTKKLFQFEKLYREDGADIETVLNADDEFSVEVG